MESNESYKSVLIIEDDDDVRDALAQLLEDEGYGVHAAHNGREGLQIASEAAPPRVIVLDLMMPIMNGWEFLAARRNDPRLRNVPVVVVSAAGDPKRLGEVTAFLRKPIDIRRLLQVVQEYAAP
jgi:CheY-like chemotaxis protein